MLTRDKLVNITIFMERAQATGKEALAWSQTYEAVVEEIKKIDELAKTSKVAAAVKKAVRK
jgi:hypothetical protein